MYSIYGQDVALKTLRNGINSDHLSNSVLFQGPDSVGKFKTALYIAKILNCKDTITKPCGKCSSCRMISNFTFPDMSIVNTDNNNHKIKIIADLIAKDNKNKKLFENLFFYLYDLINKTSNDFFRLKSDTQANRNNCAELIGELRELIKLIDKRFSKKNLNRVVKISDTLYGMYNFENIPIDTIREINVRTRQKPVYGKKKVIIFNGIEKLRKEGANTFLKTIEEPPSYIQIILITNNLSILLPTIKSRCFVLRFYPLSIDSKEKILKRVLGFEIISQFNIENRKNIFDIIEEENLPESDYEEPIKLFFHEIISRYRENIQVFSISETICSCTESIDFFFDTITKYIVKSKFMKYNINRVEKYEEHENFFSKLSSMELDNFIKNLNTYYRLIKKNNANPQFIIDNILLEFSRYKLKIYKE